MGKSFVLAAIVLIMNLPAAYAEQLDTQQIALIRDTALSICNTVKDTKGQKTDTQIQGEVRGQLNGLVGRLANVGGSGAVSLSRSQFDGLSQDATAIAVMSDRQCRERLFNKMFEQLTAAPSEGTRPIAGAGATKAAIIDSLGPGSPTREYLRRPVLAPMQATTKSGDGSLIGRHEIALYGCAINQKAIDCYLTETPQSSSSYNITDLFGKETRLSDNLHVVHPIIRAAWIDGLGNQHRDMDIGKNEPAWFVLEFGDASPDADEIRIAFKAFTGGEIKGHLVK